MIGALKTFAELETNSYLLKQPDSNGCDCACSQEQKTVINNNNECKTTLKYFKTNPANNTPGEAKNNIPALNVFKYPGVNSYSNVPVINNVMRDDGGALYDTLEKSWVCNGTTYAYKIDKYVSTNNGSYILAISSTLNTDGTPYYAFMGNVEYQINLNNIGSVPAGLQDAFLDAFLHGGPNNGPYSIRFPIPNNPTNVGLSHRNPDNVPITDWEVYAIPKTMGYSGPLIAGPFINDNAISTTSEINHVVNKYNFWLTLHSPLTPLLECIPYPVYRYQRPSTSFDEAWWLHNFGSGYEEIFISIKWTPDCPLCDPPIYTGGTLYKEKEPL